MATEMGLDTDKTTLERLNQEYIDAFMNADVDWYREHLADDRPLRAFDVWERESLTGGVGVGSARGGEGAA